MDVEASDALRAIRGVLEMDVDVIYALRDIREVLDKLVRVETILRDLDGVCRKRSEQIIAPEWEAKGSL